MTHGGMRKFKFSCDGYSAMCSTSALDPRQAFEVRKTAVDKCSKKWHIRADDRLLLGSQVRRYLDERLGAPTSIHYQPLLSRDLMAHPHYAIQLLLLCSVHSAALLLCCSAASDCSAVLARTRWCTSARCLSCSRRPPSSSSPASLATRAPPLLRRGRSSGSTGPRRPACPMASSSRRSPRLRVSRAPVPVDGAMPHCWLTLCCWLGKRAAVEVRVCAVGGSRAA